MFGKKFRIIIKMVFYMFSNQSIVKEDKVNHRLATDRSRVVIHET